MLAFISELADKKAMANEVSLGVAVGWRRVRIDGGFSFLIER